MFIFCQCKIHVSIITKVSKTHSFHRHAHRESVIVSKYERGQRHIDPSLAVVQDDIYVTLIYKNKMQLKTNIFLGTASTGRFSPSLF